MSDKDNQELKGQVANPSRRSFVKTGATIAGSAIVGGIVGNLLGGNKVVEKEKVVEKTTDYNKALMFFTLEQFKIVEAAAEQIFPEDSNGPGAKTLGVPFYIDHQLASPYGFNAKEYMQGPFQKGIPEQGYQGRLNRREIFQIGVKGLEDYSQATFKKKFIELTADEQIQVLKDFENADKKNKVTLQGTSSTTFFNLLRNLTIEGVYADPMYGGNANMEGWKMKNFPGHQMSYMKDIEKTGLVKIEPQSLNAHHKH